MSTFKYQLLVLTAKILKPESTHGKKLYYDHVRLSHKKLVCGIYTPEFSCRVTWLGIFAVTSHHYAIARTGW